jgi:hypothetical protein
VLPCRLCQFLPEGQEAAHAFAYGHAKTHCLMAALRARQRQSHADGSSVKEKLELQFINSSHAITSIAAIHALLH